MRRPQRHIEIFSLSVLDMFASALGAFIMCAIILFPYFQRVSVEAFDAAKSDLQSKIMASKAAEQAVARTHERVQILNDEMKQLRITQSNLEICKNGLNQCQAALAKNFLLLQMEWRTKKDEPPVNIDLRVIDPFGNQFSPWRTNRSGQDFEEHPTQGRLSEDSLGTCIGDKCAGIEVWLNPQADPGTYQMIYVLERPTDRSIGVSGAVVHKEGKVELRMRSFAPSRETQRIVAAKITIDLNGDLKIEQ